MLWSYEDDNIYNTVRCMRVPKSALKSYEIQYYLTATVMLKKLYHNKTGGAICELPICEATQY